MLTNNLHVAPLAIHELFSVFKMPNTDMFNEYLKISSLVLLRIGADPTTFSAASFRARRAFLHAFVGSTAATRGMLEQYHV